MNIRYHVDMSSAERAELELLLAGGSQAVRKLKRAQILLAADAGMSDDDIATSVGVGHSTGYRTRRRFVEGNLTAALSEEPRAGAERKLTEKQEALLVATACSSPPAGRARWTLELLADEMVRLTSHESLSRETVRRAPSRERSQTMAQVHVVRAKGRRGVCRAHGGCAQSVRRAIRSASACDLL